MVTQQEGHHVTVLERENSLSLFFGCKGIQNGQFYHQKRVTILFDKTVFVVDSGNYRVQKFDFSINFLAVFGSKGSVLLEFENPQGILVEETVVRY